MHIIIPAAWMDFISFRGVRPISFLLKWTEAITLLLLYIEQYSKTFDSKIPVDEEELLVLVVFFYEVLRSI
jgi:hypothetical protein